MNVLEKIAEGFAVVVGFLGSVWESVTAVGQDAFIGLWFEAGDFILTTAAAIGNASGLDAIASYEFPEPGPVSTLLVLIGVPEALAMLGAAFAIKVVLRFIPLL